MKNTQTSATAQNNEISLGWSAMPAYGEVMHNLVGTSHTDVSSTLKLAGKGVLSSFWSTLANLK